jgi:UDP:flavonoid glycosyltransferase YjiC (YdhE family)
MNLTTSEMKIVFMSIGTRGDIEPILAIGEILTKKARQIAGQMDKEDFREKLYTAIVK